MSEALAHVVDAYGDYMATIKVPIVFDGPTPDVPRLVECNGWFAYLHETNPLTYSWIEPPTKVEKI
jgi:hypothetical protein